MITVIGQGGGFNGLGLYLLHDIGSETTAERVSWTHALNLDTDSARIAVGRMCATAMAQDALKEAAGVGRGGRKLKHPLAHIVLSWHADDHPTDEQMRQAGMEALKELKAEGLQALMVAHDDTGQRHLHIMLNRINPENGVAAPLSNSQRALSKWALAYEKRHGETRCKKRQANARKRRQGLAHQGEKRVPRHLHEMGRQFRLEATAGEHLSPFERHVRDQRRIDARLRVGTREMRERHRAELKQLAAVYRHEKTGLWDAKGAEYERRRIDARQAYRERLDTLRHDHGREWGEFHAVERDTCRQARETRHALKDVQAWQLGGRRPEERQHGRLGVAFNAGVEGGARRASIVSRHQADRDSAFQAFRAEMRGTSDTLKESHKAAKGDVRQIFFDQRDRLFDRQDQEHQANGQAWQQRKVDRQAAYEGFRSAVQLAKGTRLEFGTAAQPHLPQTAPAAAWRAAADDRQSPTPDIPAMGAAGMSRHDRNEALNEPGIIPREHHATPCDPVPVQGASYEGGRSYYQVTKEAAQEVEAIRNTPTALPAERYQTTWTITTPGGDSVAIGCSPEVLGEAERQQGQAVKKDADYRAAGAQIAATETAGRKASAVRAYLNSAGAQKAALKEGAKAVAKPAQRQGRGPTIKR